MPRIIPTLGDLPHLRKVSVGGLDGLLGTVVKRSGDKTVAVVVERAAKRIITNNVFSKLKKCQ
jgi:hypothetical protein